MPMKTKDIYEFFSRLQKDNPEPKSELEYINVYTLLVAVTLSAQSTDTVVNKATRTLFQAVDTPQKMLDMGINNLKEYIRSISVF